MKFFTDNSVENEYLLVKLNNYLEIEFSGYSEILIDPGVYELTKSNEYSWKDDVNILEFLDSLPDNHYFSADYPGDMNPDYTSEFLIKSWCNALKFHTHPNYIVTVQYEFGNYYNFIKWFDWYNMLPIQSGILGLGNLCRFRTLNSYLKKCLKYAFKNCKHKRIHIYGLCLKAIPYAHKLAEQYGIEFSFDSTKWTRAVTQELKDEHGYNSVSGNRQLFFDTYKNIIKERIMEESNHE